MDAFTPVMGSDGSSDASSSACTKLGIRKLVPMGAGE